MKKVTVPDTIPPLLSVAQFADLLQVRRQTVRAWIHQRRINCIKIKPHGKGNLVRIPRSELELLLNAGFVGVDDDTPAETPAPAKPREFSEFDGEPDEYEF